MKILQQRYLEIDARTLGWLRIGFGLLLLFDLFKRACELGVWYVNTGLLPNHRALWLPGSPYQLSYLFSLWTVSQVRVAFVITGLIYFAFLVGYRTRLMHVLSWFCLLSLHTRADLTTNGGDCVLAAALLWSAFLPLGRRYGIDALRTPACAAPVRSLAVTALLWQLSVIYLFNALNKNGDTWNDGSAIHYLLHQARIVTPLGVWVREHLPANLLRGMTHATRVLEAGLPFLILWPWASVWPRRIALVCIWALHGGIALVTNFGVFSPAMMVFSLVLLSPADHDWFARRRRLGQVCNRVRECAAASWERLRLREDTPAPRPTSLGLRVDALRVWLRELGVAWILVCAVSQLVQDNPAFLSALQHRQPRAITAWSQYLRLYQGWAMFAPDAPREDFWIVVDATTARGEHIDPFNEIASRVADPSLRTVPARLEQNVYFCDYVVGIRDDSRFHDSLRDWIFNHDRRSHRPDQQIVRFDAYVVEHESPAPGSLKATNERAHVFLHAER